MLWGGRDDGGGGCLGSTCGIDGGGGGSGDGNSGNDEEDGSMTGDDYWDSGGSENPSYKVAGENDYYFSVWFKFEFT